jgi:hypothetical protein
MGYNPQNVVVALANVYIAPYDPDEPAVLPVDTVATGVEWPSTGTGVTPWVHLGFTDQGWKLKLSTKTSEIMVEEQSSPVDILADGKTMTVSGTMSESSLQHARWSYGGGTITTVAAGALQIGKQTLSLQDKLEKWAIGLDTVNAAGYWRRILLPKCIITSDVEVAFRRAAQQQMFPFEATSISDISEIDYVDMTGPATS